MDPADLLFADTRRIDCYFTQIGGPKGRIAVTAAEGILSWSPIFKVRVARKATRPTPYDKIDAVKKYLEKRNTLQFGRPKGIDPDADFVEEIANAARIEIPPRPNAPKPSKKIVLWICAPAADDEQAGILVLVQDFNYPDERATSFRKASTFSVLSALVYHTRKEINQSILSGRLMHQTHPNPHAKWGTETHPWSLSELHSVRDDLDEFAKEPAELLRSWNCSVFPERRVNVVYKVREWGREAAYSGKKTTVFGYPIWIFAA